MQTAVGAPWLTRNEARARMNLPALEGADELVAPLNVLVRWAGLTNRRGFERLQLRGWPAAVEGAPLVWEERYLAVLRAFFARQAEAVRAVVGRAGGDHETNHCGAGDFAKTSGGPANQQRILAAQWTDLKARLGTKLLPVLVRVAQWSNDELLPALTQMAMVVRDQLGPALDRVRNFFSGLSADGDRQRAAGRAGRHVLVAGVGGLGDARCYGRCGAVPMMVSRCRWAWAVLDAWSDRAR